MATHLPLRELQLAQITDIDPLHTDAEDSEGLGLQLSGGNNSAQNLANNHPSNIVQPLEAGLTAARNDDQNVCQATEEQHNVLTKQATIQAIDTSSEAGQSTQTWVANVVCELLACGPIAPDSNLLALGLNSTLMAQLWHKMSSTPIHVLDWSLDKTRRCKSTTTG